jgi:ketosteroid isomerase-like protein
MIVTQELTQSLEEAIAENNRRFVDAGGRGDAGAMASLYAIDADFLPRTRRH